MALLNNPKCYLLHNFVGGVARALGIAVGADLLASVLIYIFQSLVLLKQPVIGNFMAGLVRIVTGQLAKRGITCW